MGSKRESDINKHIARYISTHTYRYQEALPAQTNIMRNPPRRDCRNNGHCKYEGDCKFHHWGANKRSSKESGKKRENKTEAEVEVETDAIEIGDDKAEVGVETDAIKIGYDKTEVEVETDAIKIRDGKAEDRADNAPESKMRKKNEI